MSPRTIAQIAKAEPRIAALLKHAESAPGTKDPWEFSEKMMATVNDIFEDDDTISVSDYYTVKLHIIDTLTEVAS